MLRYKFLANGGGYNTGGGYTVLAASSISQGYTVYYFMAAGTLTQETTGASIKATSGAGNATQALFILKAVVGSTYSLTTSKFNFASKTQVPGTTMATGVPTSTSPDTTSGNATTAITFSYNSTTATLKYTYAGDTVSPGATMLAAASQTAAMSTGNTTIALVATQTANTNTVRYTYAGDTVAAGTALPFSQTSPGTASNASNGTQGMLTKISSSAASSYAIYDFAGDAFVFNSTLVGARNGGKGAAGNVSVAVLNMGSTLAINVYRWADQSVTSMLLNSVCYGAGACSEPQGVNV